jgi:hypothetical protein
MKSILTAQAYYPVWTDPGLYIPLDFLTKPNLDVICKIAKESLRLHELKRSYIKGHQDLKKEKKDNTLAKTYNITADQEATTI